MKITFLAICCFAVVLSTYAAPQSSDPTTGSQNPSKDTQKDPSKSSQNNPSKGSQNNGNKGKQGNGTKGQQTNGTKGQQGTSNKSNGQTKKGSKKVGNSQLPPQGNKGESYKHDSVDVEKAFNGKAGKGAFSKK